jgi:hypothetical protein
MPDVVVSNPEAGNGRPFRLGEAAYCDIRLAIGARARV